MTPLQLDARKGERGGRRGDAEAGEAWPRVPLPRVCLINPRRASGLKRSDDEPTSFVPMPAVDAGSGTIAQRLARPFREIKKGYTYFEDGDVIFAKITPCMQNGKHAVCRHLLGGFGFGSTEFHVLRPGPDLRADYLHLFLRQPPLLEDAERHLTGGVGQQRLPEDYFNEVAIPLPPLAEQERIARRLTEQLAAVDRARAAAQSRLTAAEALPAAYLREVFEGPEASGWETHLLGRLCDKLTDGTHRSPKNDLPRDKGVPYITSKNVRRFRLDLTNVTYVSQADHDEIFARCDPRQGDVLYTKDGAMLGLAAVNTLDYPFSLLSSVALIRPKPAMLDSAFLAAWLNAPGTYRGIVESQLGAAIQRLILDQIKNFEVPLPPLPTQRRLAAELTQRLAAAEGVIARCREELAAIEALPAALLRAAFERDGRQFH